MLRRFPVLNRRSRVDAAFPMHGHASPLGQPVCGPYAYFVRLAISGIRRKAMGIPMDFSGQIPFQCWLGVAATKGDAGIRKRYCHFRPETRSATEFIMRPRFVAKTPT